MTKWLQATVAAAVATATALVLLVSPASAGTMQISGIGTPVPNCDGLSSDFTIEMTGSLDGCWYTTITDSKFNPSGTYQERGTETFIGCLNGRCGTFSTTYTFTGKFVDDTFAQEIHGRCHHTIVSGTGDGFEGATGMINFKDDVEAGIFLYTGHITR